MTFEDPGPQDRQQWHEHKASRANFLSGMERRDVVADLRNTTAYPWLHSLAHLLTIAAIVWFAATCIATLPLMFDNFKMFLAGVAAIAFAGVKAVLLVLLARLARWIADLADMRVEKLIDRLQKRSKTQ
ncbi:MAG: hypothetical protein JXL80_04490 [Planctomycetes bacterium]|nr:hypothetical protein [Planctomycetota bacterium]